MFLSYIEECKPSMIQLQFLKEMKKQKQKGDWNEAEIARQYGVNRSTVSRYFKRCLEFGILSEPKYDFTKKGKEILQYYQDIEGDLTQYFEKIGVEGEALYQAVEGMLDGVDIQTIKTLCQKEKLHMKYENFGISGKEEIEHVPPEALESYIQKGVYDVDFSIYRQGKNCQKLSMADMGFEKPAVLSFLPEARYLELTIRKVQAYSGAVKDLLLEGYAQTIKYRRLDDGLKLVKVQDGKIKIPLEEFWFECPQEGELSGQIQMTITTSIGKRHMPESVATLILRL